MAEVDLNAFIEKSIYFCNRVVWGICKYENTQKNYCEQIQFKVILQKANYFVQRTNYTHLYELSRNSPIQYRQSLSYQSNLS